MGFRMELNGQLKQIDTKNVDKLAKEGVVLDSYYVQCVCSPSRVTFLTGRYPLHHGVNDWIPPSEAYGMPLNDTTIADHFKRAGFRCARSPLQLADTSCLQPHTPLPVPLPRISPRASVP